MNEIENKNGTSNGGLSFIKIIIKTTLTLPEKPLIIKVYILFKGGFLRDKFIHATRINSSQNLFSKKLCCKKVEIIPSQSELNFNEN